MRVQTVSRRVPHPFRKFSKPVVLQEVRRFILLLTGVVVGTLGYTLFQIPHNINAGGIGGLAIVINHYTGWPVGVQILLMNIPLLVTGYFFLGRMSFVVRTSVTVIMFSIAVDMLNIMLPRFVGSEPVTDDQLLSAIFAGVVGGIGLGVA
jgi:uncharacterized membrane-anchored protein YitT (DUF2179 family)